MRMADRSLENGLFDAFGRDEIDGVGVGRPGKTEHPLVESSGEVFDLPRLAVINPQAKKGRLVAVRGLRSVGDVAAVRRVLGRGVGAGIGGGNILRLPPGGAHQEKIVVGGPGSGARWLRMVRGVTDFLPDRRNGITVRSAQEKGGRSIRPGSEIARLASIGRNREQVSDFSLQPVVPMPKKEMINDAHLDLAGFFLFKPLLVARFIWAIGINF